MKEIKAVPKFMVYALSRAVRHPGTPIVYRYCPECKQYLPDNETDCPGCGRKLGNSPQLREMSPIPWWGALLVIIVGVACWVLGDCFDIIGLDEAGRALVYIPLGSLFGMSVPR
jgi:hypothetical protein